MKIEELILNGEAVAPEILESLGDLVEFYPPEMETPFWEFQFKDSTIFATDRTVVKIANEEIPVVEGEKVSKLTRRERRAGVSQDKVLEGQ